MPDKPVEEPEADHETDPELLEMFELNELRDAGVTSKDDLP